jgi:hypothetical protein
MERFYAIICILSCFVLCVMSYQVGYKQGRVDKNAEMMHKLTGDPSARVAIMTKDKLTFHPQGICVRCHGG